MYQTSLEHLAVEMRRVELWVKIRSAWMAKEGSSAEASLLKQELADLAQDNQQSIAQSRQQGIRLRLVSLAETFRLSAVEIDVLLIALAAELDASYQKWYAYLQDNLAERSPCVDLIISFLSIEDGDFLGKIKLRDLLDSSSPLIKYQLLYLVAPQPGSLWLNSMVRVDKVMVDYLLGKEVTALSFNLSYCEQPNVDLNELILADEFKQPLLNFTQADALEDKIVYLQGPIGVGKSSLVKAICTGLNMPLMVVDGEALSQYTVDEFSQYLEVMHRNLMLTQSALHFTQFSLLLAEQKSAWLKLLVDKLAQMQRLIFLSGDSAWQASGRLLRYKKVLPIVMSLPNAVDRARLWRKLMVACGYRFAQDINLQGIISQFHLTGGNIQSAIDTAYGLSYRQQPLNPEITEDQLYQACRLQSNQRLSTLAQKIEPRYAWTDIILPKGKMLQLKEIRHYIKHHTQVYQHWGFAKKLAVARGLNILFSGAPGTGKTMAAEVLAGYFKLDLYKIDLSLIISKYIGETEKNLAKIFAEGEASNAILFFDEADALFGKRSEVQSSHDRHANVEVSYLLQKMEEYPGIIVLATNFKRNVDEAFMRRLHFSIDFALPGKEERYKIWQAIWPDDAPLNADVNLQLLASDLEISGGNISNIALLAAFLAAEDGQDVNDATIGMRHIMYSAKREYQKMGHIIDSERFEKFLL